MKLAPHLGTLLLALALGGCDASLAGPLARAVLQEVLQAQGASASAGSTGAGSTGGSAPSAPGPAASAGGGASGNSGGTSSSPQGSVPAAGGGAAPSAGGTVGASGSGGVGLGLPGSLPGLALPGAWPASAPLGQDPNSDALLEALNAYRDQAGEYGLGGQRHLMQSAADLALAAAQGKPYPTEADQVEAHLIATGLKAVYTQAQVIRGPSTPAAAVAQWAQSEDGRTLLTWGWCGAGVGHALSPQGQHVWAMANSVYEKDPDGKAFAGPGRLPQGLLR